MYQILYYLVNLKGGGDTYFKIKALNLNTYYCFPLEKDMNFQQEHIAVSYVCASVCILEDWKTPNRPITSVRIWSLDMFLLIQKKYECIDDDVISFKVLGGQEKLASWLKKWGDCSFFIELYKIYCMFVQYIFSKVKLTEKSP